MKSLLTLPLLTSCSVIKLSSVGPGFATLALTVSLLVVIYAIKNYRYAKSEQHQRYEQAKREVEAEAESRRNAEKAFDGISPLRNNEPSRGYENHFAETELMASTL
jgi:hypothetical protein